MRYGLASIPASLCAGAFLLLCSPALHAQAQIEGTVLDDETEEPLTGARVSVIQDTWQTVVSRTVTDDQGRFHFSLRRGGRYRLDAERIGYADALTPAVQVRSGDSLAVEVRLDTDAVLLAPLEVVATNRRRSESSVLKGFHDRKESGLGHFITRDDIERRNPSATSHMLATVPGVRLRSGARPGAGRNVYMSRSGESCAVQVYVDGRLVNRNVPVGANTGDGRPGVRFQQDEGVTIDDFVSPGSIYGIEVYRGLSGVPAEFLNTDADCGVVVIWTRRGG